MSDDRVLIHLSQNVGKSEAFNVFARVTLVRLCVCLGVPAGALRGAEWRPERMLPRVQAERIERT